MGRMRVCPQCQESFTLAATGRPPTYCSATCRKDAWHARQVQAAVDAALQAEREGANRGHGTRNETPNRGNETIPGAGEECPYCRGLVFGLVEHLGVCPDGPGAHID